MSDNLITWLRAAMREIEVDARFYIEQGTTGPGLEWAQLALADVDAKRHILDAHPLEGPSKYVPFQYCGTCQDGDGIPTGPAPCPTLRALTLPYADRPGYRSEWRPA